MGCSSDARKFSDPNQNFSGRLSSLLNLKVVCKARRPRYEFTTVVFCGDSPDRLLEVFLVSVRDDIGRQRVS